MLNKLYLDKNKKKKLVKIFVQPTFLFSLWHFFTCCWQQKVNLILTAGEQRVNISRERVGAEYNLAGVGFKIQSHADI